MSNIYRFASPAKCVHCSAAIVVKQYVPCCNCATHQNVCDGCMVNMLCVEGEYHCPECGISNQLKNTAKETGRRLVTESLQRVGAFVFRAHAGKCLNFDTCKTYINGRLAREPDGRRPPARFCAAFSPVDASTTSALASAAARTTTGAAAYTAVTSANPADTAGVTTTTTSRSVGEHMIAALPPPSTSASSSSSGGVPKKLKGKGKQKDADNRKEEKQDDRKRGCSDPNCLDCIACFDSDTNTDGEHLERDAIDSDLAFRLHEHAVAKGRKLDAEKARQEAADAKFARELQNEMN